MNVSLPSDQMEWLETQVAAGRFGSVEEALSLAVADLRAIEADDLAWAKPYVDEALASVERGDVSSGDDFLKRLDGKLAALRAR